MNSSVVAELRSNRRLRLGIVAVVGIFWVYGLLSLSEGLDKRQAQLNANLAAYARQLKSADDPYWPNARDEVKLVLNHYLARARTEQSEGTLQASFTDWVQQLFAAHKVSPGDVSVSVLPPEQGNAWPAPMRVVRARVFFHAHPWMVHDILADVSDQSAWVERLVVRTGATGGQTSVEMDVSALYTLQSGKNAP